MGMTATQKIIAKHVGKEEVKPGELVLASTDLILANDITAPVAIKEFEKAGFNKVFDKNKIALVLDHFAPNKDIKSAMQCKITRDFAKKYNIKNFFEGPNGGIEHALLPEVGLVEQGNLIIGADSHTCTYGALNAFSAGVGSTDFAVSMYLGKVWLKVPTAIKINIIGNPQKYVCGKDVILHLIGKIGVDGALYKSLEFTGEGIENLTIDDRFTIANMAVECGAKNALFPYDSICKDYLLERGIPVTEGVEADTDAPYEREITINLTKLSPMVACPSLPSNVMTARAAEEEDIRIDQVVIGSCTNGRFSDLVTAAEILRGKKVARGVRAIVIPATYNIYKKALKEGILEIFLDAGFIISPPTCGPCLGGFMGVLAEGERAIATTNRNFVGRMGHKTSELYLSSPAVAAISSITGKISSI